MCASCKAEERSALRVLSKKRAKQFAVFVAICFESFRSTYLAQSRTDFIATIRVVSIELRFILVRVFGMSATLEVMVV